MYIYVWHVTTGLEGGPAVVCAESLEDAKDLVRRRVEKHYGTRNYAEDGDVSEPDLEIECRWEPQPFVFMPKC